ncbi:non-specific lipid transfer protein GPI-anchored 9-like [Rhodamnia argentea]|uniref:Non-specific lipid transfer protein GPI-anchored 9-like n=1 Tax=Rhodamnia argentea TaxID=178133 RepID=A0A8B8NGC7_9MYRT|nr:non-specific lipid transfer protein GPI-anchored 9-like [Rhodamnia argentea]
MAPKFLFPLLLLFSSWATRISSEGLANLVNGVTGAYSTSLCMQKLIPCQAYLTGSSAPPDSCCGPLKELVTGESQCLCQVFNNPDALTSLGITQAGALALAKTCGADADISVCNKGAATSPTSSPATPADSQSTPADISTLSNATLTAAASLIPETSRATSRLAGSGVVTLCSAMIISKLW